MDEEPPRNSSIPPLVWAGLALLVVLAFIFLVRGLNPPSPGRTPPTPNVAVPANPAPAPLPDVKPSQP